MKEWWQHMSTAVATNGRHGIADFDAEQVDLIRRTIAKECTDDELVLFLHQCRRTGLDPFSRQIHAVKRWDSSQNRKVITIQTGIDGLRLIAERTGKYAGNDDPQYDTEESTHPKKATVTVWKMVSGQRVPFTRSARWAEFVQTNKDGGLTRFWAKMPYLMLGKVAEALALRAAFPQELSGIYSNEEMHQADSESIPILDAPPGAPPTPQQTVDNLRNAGLSVQFGSELPPQPPKQPKQPEPSATITQEQIKLLIAAFGGEWTDEAAFCSAWKIKDIVDLPATRFQLATAQISLVNTIEMLALDKGIPYEEVVGEAESLFHLKKPQLQALVEKLKAAEPRDIPV